MPEIDLIAFLDEHQEKRIMAAARLDKDESWCSESVPYKGGISALVEPIRARFPDLFASVKDAELYLMNVHFRNMHFKQNTAGQQYPGWSV
jgi:hypothetical protein